MQGMILAAGMGTRLGSLTAENTKCMVQVNGVTLIERLLRQLEQFGLSRIVVVTGFKGEKLRDFIGTLGIRTEIVFVDNPIYDRTNNIYSLYLVRDYLLREDTMLFESDMIFEDGIISSLYADPRPTLALVDKYESWMDGTVVRLSEADEILDVIPGKEFNFSDAAQYFKTVNVYKFSSAFSRQYYVPFLEAYIHAVGNSVYYENVLRILTMLDNTGIHAKRLDGERWYEIDDLQDLEIASITFAEPEEQLKMFQESYGGYWSFPKLLDSCYLVTPYYPPRRLIDEMQASFTDLLTQYPSGIERNCLLAAKHFRVEKDRITIGNGAAELIKSLAAYLGGGTYGFIRPTFEEYPNRLTTGKAVVMQVSWPDFSYTADDVMDFFGKNPVQTLFIINPDNPSGNYIPRADVLRLADWAEAGGMRLVVDESFVDFADERDGSILSDAVLEAHPHLVVVKSISKSHGVPGIRLGVLAGADRKLIDFIKKDVAIWNINSFGQFYLQIAGKYRKDYAAALTAAAFKEKFFTEKLHAQMSQGVSYAAAVTKILSEVTGLDEKLLRQPNTILAIEYLRALPEKISPLLIKRIGAAYDDLTLQEKFSSASAIRAALREKFPAWEKIAAQVDAETLKILRQEKFPDEKFLFRPLMTKLLTSRVDELKKITPNLGAGVYRFKQSKNSI